MNQASDAERVMNALRRSVRALRSANLEATRRFGIGAAQLFVLREIAIAPGLSLAELAARTHAGQSSVSEVVSRLVADGLVIKTHSAADRRRVVLDVTDRGAAIVGATPVSVQERLITGFRAMSVEDGRRLADLLEAWLSASGIDSVPATMFFAREEEKVPISRAPDSETPRESSGNPGTCRGVRS